MGFLHKDLTLFDKNKINEDVKKIIDSFEKSLSSLKSLPEEGGIEKESSLREEKGNEIPDKVFREKVFENAFKKNKDFLIAEKKSW
ncbi:MAG: hypothetical protein KC516_04325 [Nanoarchaeota archaeon]|nr:hypothetical protein [Nanoarchaeota archaeon]